MIFTDLFENKDICRICGQTPCNCTHVAESAGSVGDTIRSLYQQFYDQGDDALEYLNTHAENFARYWDRFEGDLDSMIEELPPKILARLAQELQSVAGQQGVAEGGPFSYGVKKPRQGSVVDLAAKKRKEQDKNYKPIEPKDQMVGTAKVTKGVAEGQGTLSPEVQTKVEQMAQRFATLLRNNILRIRKENVSRLGYSKEEADQEAKEAVQQIRFVAKNLSKNWQASDWIIDVADTGAKGIYNILMNQKGIDEFNWESKYPGITQALNQAFTRAWQSVDGPDQQGVAEGHADQQRKIFKKNGKPVGEVGIDRESSPGNGQWYMKCYVYDIDNSGYDSYEEAVAELKHCLKQGVAEGSEDDRQWSNKDNEQFRRAVKDIEDNFGPNDAWTKTKQHQIKQQIKTKPMSGPKGQLPEQGVAEGSEQSYKVTYDVYGGNKEKPLYTKTRTVRASSEKEAIDTLRKLVGGTNHRVEKQGVAEGRFDEPLTGWHIVYRNSGNPVHATPSFETKEQAQKYLMTKMFANHQDYKVVHTAGVGVAEGSSDYFRRREREEKIISGEKPARKKQPSQTSDYARRREQERKKEQGVAEGLPQTLRKVVPGHAKREIDRKMDAGKFGKTDADKDANFQRYKKIQDKLKEQGVAEALAQGNYNVGLEDIGKRVTLNGKTGDPAGYVLIGIKYTPGGLQAQIVNRNLYTTGYYDLNDISKSKDQTLGEQGVAEGAGNIGPAIKSLYKKIYRAGDDEIEYFYNDSPVFAQYWDEYEGDLNSIIAEVDPAELQIIYDELKSYVDQANLAEGEVTRTPTGLVHKATDRYGAGDDEHLSTGGRSGFANPGKYARDLDHVNKQLVKDLDAGMGVTWKKNGREIEVDEVSDKTLIDYLNKVHADSQKHEKDPTKRSPEKASRSVGGFARAFNKLDARKEPVNEIDPNNYDSDWDYYAALKGKRPPEDDDIDPPEDHNDYDPDEESYYEKSLRARGLDEQSGLGFGENDEKEADYGKSYQDMVKRMGAKAREQERSRPVDIGALARKLRDIEKKSGN